MMFPQRFFPFYFFCSSRFPVWQRRLALTGNGLIQHRMAIRLMQWLITAPLVPVSLSVTGAILLSARMVMCTM